MYFYWNFPNFFRLRQKTRGGHIEGGHITLLPLIVFMSKNSCGFLISCLEQNSFRDPGKLLWSLLFYFLFFQEYWMTNKSPFPFFFGKIWGKGWFKRNLPDQMPLLPPKFGKYKGVFCTKFFLWWIFLVKKFSGALCRKNKTDICK